MGSMESNARWHEMAALREELDTPAVVIPICVSRLDGKPARTLAQGEELRGGAVVHRRLDADLGRAQPPASRLSAPDIQAAGSVSGTGADRVVVVVAHLGCAPAAGRDPVVVE